PAGTVPVLADPVILEEARVEIGGEAGAAAGWHPVRAEDGRRDARKARAHAEPPVRRRALDVERTAVARVHPIEDRLDRALLAIIGGRLGNRYTPEGGHERMQQEARDRSYDARRVGRDCGQEGGPPSGVGPSALRAVGVDIVAHR